MAKGEFRKQLREQSIAEGRISNTPPRNNIVVQNNAPSIPDFHTRPVIRGDIYYFEKGASVGVVQEGGRPAVIVSNNACNDTSEFVMVVYLTTQPKTYLPTHVKINSTPKASIALCEQVHTLSKLKMQNYQGHVSDEEMERIDAALGISLCHNIEDLRGLSSNIELLEKQVLELENINISITQSYESQLEDLRLANSSLAKANRKLHEELDSKSEVASIPNVKTEIERDMYKKLYDELLAKCLKAGI